MKYYVSSDDVKKSIDYFKNAGFDTDDNLPLFLISKHMGITTSYAITFSAGKLSSDQKNNGTHAMWMLGGLFDENEKCLGKGFMFPMAFKKNELYQPGTNTDKVFGRAKDTIEKKNHNVPLYNDHESMLTLKADYKDLIRDNYLKGNKISLSSLAAWLFRFTSFDFEADPNEKEFTRVVEKAIRKFFKITKNDFLWLFEDDVSLNRLTPAKSGITGTELRSCFSFKNGEGPDIQPVGSINPVYSNNLGKELVKQYLALNGDNPSDDDIFAILKEKKQIVLTGVPGVGKSRYTTLLSENSFFEESEMIQFHPSYSYEDFIGAEILTTNKSTHPDENGTYEDTRKGTFLSFVDKAKANPGKNYLFIIDELNRGNIAEIFGETILALDRNYKVKLTKEYQGTSELQIPENLYIVGTMNTSDRNIAFLDLAIRRRFAFIPLYPNYDLLSEEVTLEDIDLGIVLKMINQRIVSVLKDPELVLGQSYFIPPAKSGKYVWDYPDFKNQFNFVILPTLREYSFNEASAVNTIVGENLADGIQDVDDFKIAFESEFSA